MQVIFQYRLSKSKLIASELGQFICFVAMQYAMTDLIIIDIALKLEDLVRKHPLGHLFASASPESTTNTDVMNSGLLILKNSEFITTWLLKKC